MNDNIDSGAVAAPLQKWLEIKAYINRALMSPVCWGVELALAFLIAALDLEVAGAMIFVWIFIAKLVLCRDALAPLVTLLLMCVFLSDCYDSAQTFLPYIWMAIPVAGALLFHALVYRPRLRTGRNLWGQVAVTVAVTLGGIGTISAGEYFNVTSLYYVGFLGLGMLVAYIGARAYIRVQRDYDIFERFAGMLYTMGIMCCLSIAIFYFRGWEQLMETHVMVEFQCSNNLATMLMFALPMPCYFASKGGLRRLHLLGFALLYAGIFLSGSRGGLLLGTVELFICILYLCYADRGLWFIYGLVGVGLMLLIGFNADALLSFYGISGVGGIVSQEEARYGLWGRMLEDWRANPLFGRGLGYRGNEDLYSPREGAMNWYHMMIPQVVGSMGIVGVMCYGLQLGLRAFTVFRRISAYKLALGVSYAGLLLMSQVNPGEFCPIPYALLGVLLFVMLELRDEMAPHRSRSHGSHKGERRQKKRKSYYYSKGGSVNHFDGHGYGD